MVALSFAERKARLDARAGHPNGEAERMMIAAVIVGGGLALARHRAPEFARIGHSLSCNGH
jgi:hypothetical protein